MIKSIAIFGSAFNPPSLGHKSVLERLKHFDQVLLLPSFTHAWGKVMIDYSARCELVEAFISDIGQKNLTLSRLEEEMAVGDESITTYAVLVELQKRHPNASLTFVVGPDNFLKFSQFYQAEQILSKWQVLACPETVNIRSTVIRDKIVKKSDISHLTTPKVATLLSDEKRFMFR
ncbi:nicotinate-nicotinamide nucleotide adenylyltransferase [Photobacterium frigidiphilum]|uniref:nicotinate-nucleotide adenylyltransferase n=1 Tax=Photobacterium frigidiphilum TaxID=264736 RepID=A0A2T3J838_9GAMM|nr:nicotinate-nicotinamide nucleotide adenylyltransferase [Photobacterium frigidiphilum]PSU44892.1 nicotinate-nicotinamide nucleotide adenylyltransferase [Photobacterium frigidiphilum]